MTLRTDAGPARDADRARVVRAPVRLLPGQPRRAAVAGRAGPGRAVRRGGRGVARHRPPRRPARRRAARGQRPARGRPPPGRASWSAGTRSSPAPRRGPTRSWTPPAPRRPACCGTPTSTATASSPASRTTSGARSARSGAAGTGCRTAAAWSAARTRRAGRTPRTCTSRRTPTSRPPPRRPAPATAASPPAWDAVGRRVLDVADAERRDGGPGGRFTWFGLSRWSAVTLPVGLVTTSTQGSAPTGRGRRSAPSVPTHGRRTCSTHASSAGVPAACGRFAARSRRPRGSAPRWSACPPAAISSWIFGSRP